MITCRDTSLDATANRSFGTEIEKKETGIQVRQKSVRLLALLATRGLRDFVVGPVERRWIAVRLNQEVLAHADAVTLEGFAVFLFVAHELGADAAVRVLAPGLAVRVLLAFGGAEGLDRVDAFSRVRVAEVRSRAVRLVASVVALGGIQRLGALLETDAAGAFRGLDVQDRHRWLAVFVVQVDIRNVLSYNAIAAEIGLFTAKQDSRCCQQQSYRPHSHLFCPPCDVHGHVFCHLT